MRTARIVVWLTALLIIGVSILSGPLTDGIQFTSPPVEPSTASSQSSLGTGELSLQVHSTPSHEIQLERTKYGSDTYLLDVPDAVVNITHIEGRPLVVYKIRIPELGYTRGATHFLSAESTGRTNLSIDSDAFSPSKITKESYDAELVILARVNGTEELLAQQNVTVVRSV